MKGSARLATLLLLWGALAAVRPSTTSAAPVKLTDDVYTQTGSATNFGNSLPSQISL